MNMKLIARIVTGAVITALPIFSANAQTTTFNNGDAGNQAGSWSDALNWTNGSPATLGATTVVHVGVVPTGGFLGLDTGVIQNTIASLTFDNTLAGDVQFVPGGPEQLAVNGSILNLSTHNMTTTMATTIGANATLGGGPTGGTLTFDGSLDIQTFTVTATGQVTLAGNLSATTGSLVAGDGTTATTLVVSGNSNAQFAGTFASALNGVLQFGDGGTTGDFGAATAIVDNGQVAFNHSDTLTESLVISGSGGITQMGTGTTVLTAANTFSGNSSVTAGTLNLSNSLALQNATLLSGGTGIVFDSSVSSHAFTLGGLAGSGNLALIDNAGTPNAVALSVGNANTSPTYSGILSGAGSLTKIGSGTFTLSGANTYTGATTITAGALAVNGSTAAGSAVSVGTAGTLAGSGTIGGATTTTGGAIVNLTGGTINNTLTATGGNWNGTGTVSGQVTQQTSGIFTIGSAANLIATTGVNLTGGAIAGTGTLTGSLNDTSATNSTFAGVIAGNGNTVTVNNGATNLTLSGANTYTGATTVTAGTLTLNGSTAAGSAVSVASGGTLAGTGTVNGNASVAGGTLNMTGGHMGGTLGTTGATTVNGSETVTGLTTASSGTLTIGAAANLTAAGGVNVTGGSFAGTGTITGSVNDTSAAASTYAGVIAGSGSAFTLNNNAAVVTFSGANTYTGATTITAGRLIVTGSTAAGSAVTVGTNGILAGSGTVNGPLTVQASGAIAPGATAGTAGTLNVGNLGFTINSGGVLDLDLNTATTVGGGVNDLIALGGGTLTFGGTTTININALGALATGSAYTLINGATSISGFDPNNFTITGLPSNLTAVFSDTASSLLITFTASANNFFFTGAQDTVFSNANNYATTATGTVTPAGPIDNTSNLFFTADTPQQASAATTGNIEVGSITFTPAGSGFLISGSGTITVDNGVTVQTGVAGTETFSAPLALGANQTFTVTDAGSILALQGGLSGAFSLNKAGAGILELDATTYTGATTVSAGILRADSNDSLAGTSSVTVSSGAALQLNGVTTSAATPLTLNGTGVGGNGALESLGNNTYTGLITLGSAASIGSDSGTLALTNTGIITGSGFGLLLTGTASGTLASVIGTGAGTLTKSGAGHMDALRREHLHRRDVGHGGAHSPSAARAALPPVAALVSLARRASTFQPSLRRRPRSRISPPVPVRSSSLARRTWPSARRPRPRSLARLRTAATAVRSPRTARAPSPSAARTPTAVARPSTPASWLSRASIPSSAPVASLSAAANY